MISMTPKERQRGATAMFIVIFAALLFLIVTLGFIRIMVQEQVQSTDSELSRSAYDAAMGGVEDGKRILTMANCSVAGDPVCAQIQNKSCDLAQRVLGIGDGKEVLIKTVAAGGSVTATSFDQAYTCLKVQNATSDYEGIITDGSIPDVVNLKGESPYTKIKLSWYTKEDATTAAGGAGGAGSNLYYAPSTDLVDLDEWKTKPLRPPIMRATFIPENPANHDSDDKTLYLFPRFSVGSINPATASFTLDNRRTGSSANSVQMMQGCIQSFASAVTRTYACEAILTLPTSPTNSYLYLASPYSGVHYKVELIGGGGTPVNFDGVQPAVDSTGRAGDVFRRVRARVEQVTGADGALYPRATVDITNNFCKVFAVGTLQSIYDTTSGACDPTRAGI